MTDDDDGHLGDSDDGLKEAVKSCPKKLTKKKVKTGRTYREGGVRQHQGQGRHVGRPHVRLSRFQVRRDAETQENV